MKSAGCLSVSAFFLLKEADKDYPDSSKKAIRTAFF
jgi:hypothetical protein